MIIGPGSIDVRLGYQSRVKQLPTKNSIGILQRVMAKVVRANFDPPAE